MVKGNVNFKPSYKDKAHALARLYGVSDPEAALKAFREKPEFVTPEAFHTQQQTK